MCSSDLPSEPDHAGRPDKSRSRLGVNNERVKLTPTEFKILSVLVQNANKIITRDALIESVWGMDPSSADSYLVKLHIQHLRKKLGDSGIDPKFIITVRGFGYKVPA